MAGVRLLTLAGLPEEAVARRGTHRHSHAGHTGCPQRESVVTQGAS